MAFGHGDCGPRGTAPRPEMDGVHDSSEKQEGCDGFGQATSKIQNPVEGFNGKEAFSLSSQFLEGFVRNLFSPWHA